MGFLDRMAGRDRGEEPTGPPALVVETVERWEAAGRPRQEPVSWPREAWIEGFPDAADVFSTLPDLIGRDEIRAAVATVPHTQEGAATAFAVCMAWECGAARQAPRRAQTILDANPRGAGALARTRQLAAEPGLTGALSAYRMLSRAAKMERFAADAGTRFLYAHNHEALMLGSEVADWFNVADDTKIAAKRWSPHLYERYVSAMGEWAAALGLAPDLLEEVASGAGSQAGRSS